MSEHSASRPPLTMDQLQSLLNSNPGLLAQLREQNATAPMPSEPPPSPSTISETEPPTLEERFEALAAQCFEIFSLYHRQHNFPKV